MPKDRITQLHQGYGFVEFLGEEDADYAIKVMNMIKVYGKPIRVNKVLYVWTFQDSKKSFFSAMYMLIIIPLSKNELCYVHKFGENEFSLLELAKGI